MPKPTPADELKCKFVVFEIPKHFNDKKGYAKKILAEPRQIIVEYAESKTCLYGRTANGKAYTSFNMKTAGLEDFLIKLAEEGLDKEKEFAGIMWSFCRDIE